MPYEWSKEPTPDNTEWQLSLWPYRSLLRKDFVTFIGGTIALITLPLLAVIGSAVLWGLLPFLGLALWGLWTAIDISYKRGEIVEELKVTAKTVHLMRQNPDKTQQFWEANRYWVSVHLHPKGGPVENYITLRGGDREVEIGSFLDGAERLALYGELKRALRL
jgi:uncharacterized membrane protein